MKFFSRTAPSPVYREPKSGDVTVKTTTKKERFVQSVESEDSMKPITPSVSTNSVSTPQEPQRKSSSKGKSSKASKGKSSKTSKGKSSKSKRSKDSSLSSKITSKSKKPKKRTEEYDFVIDRVPTVHSYNSEDSREEILEERSKASRYSVGDERDQWSDEDDRYSRHGDDALDRIISASNDSSCPPRWRSWSDDDRDFNLMEGIFSESMEATEPESGTDHSVLPNSPSPKSIKSGKLAETPHPQEPPYSKAARSKKKTKKKNIKAEESIKSSKEISGKSSKETSKSSKEISKSSKKSSKSSKKPSISSKKSSKASKKKKSKQNEEFEEVVPDVQTPKSRGDRSDDDWEDYQSESAHEVLLPKTSTGVSTGTEFTSTMDVNYDDTHPGQVLSAMSMEGKEKDKKKKNTKKEKKDPGQVLSAMSMEGKEKDKKKKNTKKEKKEKQKQTKAETAVKVKSPKAKNITIGKSPEAEKKSKKKKEGALEGKKTEKEKSEAKENGKKAKKGRTPVKEEKEKIVKKSTNKYNEDALRLQKTMSTRSSKSTKSKSVDSKAIESARSKESKTTKSKESKTTKSKDLKSTKSKSSSESPRSKESNASKLPKSASPKASMCKPLNPFKLFASKLESVKALKSAESKTSKKSNDAGAASSVATQKIETAILGCFDDDFGQGIYGNQAVEEQLQADESSHDDPFERKLRLMPSIRDELALGSFPMELDEYSFASNTANEPALVQCLKFYSCGAAANTTLKLINWQPSKMEEIEDDDEIMSQRRADNLLASPGGPAVEVVLEGDTEAQRNCMEDQLEEAPDLSISTAASMVLEVTDMKLQLDGDSVASRKKRRKKKRSTPSSDETDKDDETDDESIGISITSCEIPTIVRTPSELAAMAGAGEVVVSPTTKQAPMRFRIMSLARRGKKDDRGHDDHDHEPVPVDSQDESEEGEEESEVGEDRKVEDRKRGPIRRMFGRLVRPMKTAKK